MARLFHPDKNQHSQESDVMEMINEAKEELENTLRHNGVKYAIPDRQYSHRNIMNYSFNEFFNTLRKRRVMKCIVIFLD